MTFDLLIKHGTVIDGTGRPGVAADVGVSDGRITAVAPALEGEAARDIDASGRIVAPGFIDAHTHSDFTLLSAPGADSKVRQGITTEVVGNCGFSPAPVAAQTLGLLKEYVGFLNADLPWNWQRLGEYYQRVSDQGCALNLVPLVGHGAVRIAVMGFADRAPSADELVRMQRLVGESHGGRCLRSVIGPDLHPRMLRRHGRARCPGAGGAAGRRRLRHAHAGRGRHA